MLNWKNEWKPLALIIGVFLAFYYLPLESARFEGALMEAFHLAREYARDHVILCLLPAFFIAGAITVFLSQQSVMKYLGAGARKVVAYSVASISGSILAVCSCTVLPLFAGIYRMGAGLGPATAFLYSGPAINILAIILTARILGLVLGVARAVGAVVFSIVIGLAMHLIFRGEERQRAASALAAEDIPVSRPLRQTALYFAAMVAILVFANWGKPQDGSGLWQTIYSYKWWITALTAVLLGLMLFLWFRLGWKKLVTAAALPFLVYFMLPGKPVAVFAAGIIGLTGMLGTGDGEMKEWLSSTWTFTRQIMPLLFAGVLVAGLALGRPGQEGLIPSSWVGRAVGGNSLGANLFASVAGALMYFATLTEIPILQGLIGNGMGKGPSLALLLAGPALSLPNMLVIRSIMGTKKTLVFILLVVIMATLTGMVYGKLFA